MIARTILPAMATLCFAVVANAQSMPTANTEATSSSGHVHVVGIDDYAGHMHGGPAAWVGGATFEFTVAEGSEVEMTVTRIEFLTGRSCENPPSEVSSEPSFGGLWADQLGMTESALALTLPSGLTEVSVGFAAVEAYYVYCDRFAFRVTFDVDGEELVAVSETLVTRREPLR